jgi:menaquinone reductase, multiheme cytochrome c subunit
MYSSSLDKKIKRVFMIAGPLVLAAALAFYFGRHPAVMDVGYRPQQPVPFDHLVHVKQLEIKCVYCHTSVEESAHSTVPPTSTCMNCHVVAKRDSPKLELVRTSHETGMTIPWIRIHQLPEYAFFNHSRHVKSGIDCASCHGEVENMAVISQKKSLTMGWCLDCHRDPDEFVIRTREISGVDVRPEVLSSKLNLGPENCSACHH